MRSLTDLRIAAAALRAAVSVASPRGSAVLEAARTVGRAARRAGYGPAQLSAFLGRTLLPALHTHHPGPGGEWLWERVVAAVRAAHAEPAATCASVAARAVARRATRVAAPTAVPAEASAEVPPVVYRINADDVITRVNAAWGVFAAANGAPALAAHAVGTALWAHIGGAETQRLYGAVYEAVRRSGRAVALPFRCDAPAEQRWMQLTVRPVGRGHLQVASTLVRRAVRPPVPLLDPAAPRGTTQLHMCSWCKRVRLDVGRASDGPLAGPEPWVDVEAVAGILPNALPDAPGDATAGPAALPRVVHDVCADCAADVCATLASA